MTSGFQEKIDKLLITLSNTRMEIKGDAFLLLNGILFEKSIGYLITFSCLQGLFSKSINVLYPFSVVARSILTDVIEVAFISTFEKEDRSKLSAKLLINQVDKVKKSEGLGEHLRIGLTTEIENMEIYGDLKLQSADLAADTKNYSFNQKIEKIIKDGVNGRNVPLLGRIASDWELLSKFEHSGIVTITIKDAVKEDVKLKSYFELVFLRVLDISISHIENFCSLNSTPLEDVSKDLLLIKSHFIERKAELNIILKVDET